nr:integrase, catalytic region, zinc finger, CCHC-type, peptidase aspartic, catalytic [Tanacetum cinerariifolium]
LTKYSKLSAAEAIQADCDVKATNIILQGLPPEVYALVSTHKVAKELWERIQMLMHGTSLTKQERECKLYDAFDKFAYQKGKTLRDFYIRFSLLINDMNMYNMKLEQFQVNTNENLGKLQPKVDIGIFIGYAPSKKAFRIYNRRTRHIVETIHVYFDELTAIASEQRSSGPALNEMIPRIISSGLVQKSSPSASYVPRSWNDWDLLFQLMFDELLNPPPSVVNQVAEVIAPIAKVIPQVDDDSTGSPSSTTVD